MSNLNLKLKLLEEKQKLKGVRKVEPKGLSVYYGWAKLNKIRKKEAISVIFENDDIPPRSQGFISKMQNTVYIRRQTPDEEKDAKFCNRSFSEYCIFLNDKSIKGSLSRALSANFESDRNNVSEEDRIKIAEALRTAFLDDHPGYKEPNIQLNLF